MYLKSPKNVPRSEKCTSRENTSLSDSFLWYLSTYFGKNHSLSDSLNLRKMYLKSPKNVPQFP